MSATSWRRLRIGGFLLLILLPVLIGLIGPLLAQLGPQTSQAPFGPSVWSPFGTDRLGRDVAVAALLGGRSLIVVTTATAVVTYAIGFVLGAIAATTQRRWIEELIMRPIDVLLCLPSLLLIILAALYGKGSALAVAAAVGLASLAPIVRFVRMAARSSLHGPVMDALVLTGASWFTRYVRVGLRAMLRPVAADFGVRLSAMIYILASANFLGLGFDQTSPDWAVTVAANKDALLVSPGAVLVPAGLIVSLVVGINLLWDELLRDPTELARQRALMQARAEQEGGRQ